MNWKRFAIGAGLVALGAALMLAVVVGTFFLLPSPSTPSVEMEPRAIGIEKVPIWVVVNTGQITQTTNFTGQSWGSQGYSLADVYYNVDQVATYPAVLTLTLQVSPNNSNWYTYVAATDVLTNSSTDTSGYTATLPVHLQFFRITATVSNTVAGTAVTPTIKVLLH